MSATTVSLAYAKARLSELSDLAASGQDVIITKHGKPVAQLSRAERARKPVDLAALRQLTDAMPAQSETAGDFMRRLRDEAQGTGDIAR